MKRKSSYVELVVTGTGRGIEPGSLGSVFDRFWQGADVRDSHNGLGLGLSIVKEIINLHGGSIFAYSEGMDKGSAFTVRLHWQLAKLLCWSSARHRLAVLLPAGTSYGLS